MNGKREDPLYIMDPDSLSALENELSHDTEDTTAHWTEKYEVPDVVGGEGTGTKEIGPNVSSATAPGTTFLGDFIGGAQEQGYLRTDKPKDPGDFEFSNIPQDILAGLGSVPYDIAEAKEGVEAVASNPLDFLGALIDLPGGITMDLLNKLTGSKGQLALDPIAMREEYEDVPGSESVLGMIDQIEAGEITYDDAVKIVTDPRRYLLSHPVTAPLDLLGVLPKGPMRWAGDKSARLRRQITDPVGRGVTKTAKWMADTGNEYMEKFFGVMSGYPSTSVVPSVWRGFTRSSPEAQQAFRFGQGYRRENLKSNPEAGFYKGVETTPATYINHSIGRYLDNLETDEYAKYTADVKEIINTQKRYDSAGNLVQPGENVYKLTEGLNNIKLSAVDNAQRFKIDPKGRAALLAKIREANQSLGKTRKKVVKPEIKEGFYNKRTGEFFTDDADFAAKMQERYGFKLEWVDRVPEVVSERPPKGQSAGLAKDVTFDYDRSVMKLATAQQKLIDNVTEAVLDTKFANIHDIDALKQSIASLVEEASDFHPTLRSNAYVARIQEQLSDLIGDVDERYPEVWRRYSEMRDLRHQSRNMLKIDKDPAADPALYSEAFSQAVGGATNKVEHLELLEKLSHNAGEEYVAMVAGLNSRDLFGSGLISRSAAVRMGLFTVGGSTVAYSFGVPAILAALGSVAGFMVTGPRPSSKLLMTIGRAQGWSTQRIKNTISIMKTLREAIPPGLSLRGLTWADLTFKIADHFRDKEGREDTPAEEESEHWTQEYMQDKESVSNIVMPGQ